VYGILFDERIHHTKCTKNTQKHEKERISWVDMQIVPSPVPQHQKSRKSTKFTKRGTGAEERISALFEKR
jgi:hypothetical protein